MPTQATRSEIEARIVKILTDSFGEDAKQLDVAQPIAEQLDLDSLDFVDIGMELEDVFGISIADGGAAATETPKEPGAITLEPTSSVADLARKIQEARGAD